MEPMRAGEGAATYHAIMAWSASVLVHAALASAGAALAASRPPPPSSFWVSSLRAPAPRELVLELPVLLAPEAVDPSGAPPPTPEPLQRGGAAEARPDGERAGRGGEATSRSPAINLAARDDGAHSTPLLSSHEVWSQHARHRQGHGRRSPEDDTVTDQPMMLTLFLDGDGLRAEQRPAAPIDPGHGGPFGGALARRGGPPVTRWEPAHWEPGVGLSAPRLEHDGNATYDGLAGGVFDSWWNASSGLSAHVMHARPMGLEGRFAATANRRGPYADDVNAEQHDVSTEQELLHASGAGGPLGAGIGGEPGPHPQGSGGVSGPGSRARPLGVGHGDGVDPVDARRQLYRRLVFARVQARWSASDFPKEAVLEGKNGFTQVRFVIHQDGSVSGIATVRRSGYPTFDAKMRAAVQRAAPFPLLPKELGTTEVFVHPFRVDNPAVR